MRILRKTNLIASSIAVLMFVACINGTPGSTGNSSVSRSSSSNSTTSKSTNDSQQQAIDNSTGMSPTIPKPIVNVYLETSGSMNGYVNGGTSIFQQVVKEYLSGINNADFASAVNYYYINSQIIPKGNDLSQYISNLTPQSFASQGNTATTDIGGLFKKIMEATDNNTISIFISDCIISPGRSNDPATYARGQMTDVRDAIVGYINKYQDLACLVYQFDSNFRGTYYDYLNTPHRNIDMQRPFYIWVFGHTLHVASLKLGYVPDSDFKIAPIRNQWIIFNTPLAELQDENKYGVLLSTGANNGRYVRNSATTVSNVQPFNNFYRFSFGAQLKMAQALMGDEYVCDVDNYKVIIDRERAENFYGSIEKNLAATSPYTHIFRVDSDKKFSRGTTFNMAFLPMIPKWAYSISDNDDRTFYGENDNKTYGIINIFNGVYSGFNNGIHNNIIAKFDFEIK